MPAEPYDSNYFRMDSDSDIEEGRGYSAVGVIDYGGDRYFAFVQWVDQVCDRVDDHGVAMALRGIHQDRDTVNLEQLRVDIEKYLDGYDDHTLDPEVAERLAKICQCETLYSLTTVEKNIKAEVFAKKAIDYQIIDCDLPYAWGPQGWKSTTRAAVTILGAEQFIIPIIDIDTYLDCVDAGFIHFTPTVVVDSMDEVNLQQALRFGFNLASIEGNEKGGKKLNGTLRVVLPVIE